MQRKNLGGACLWRVVKKSDKIVGCRRVPGSSAVVHKQETWKLTVDVWESRKV